MSERLVVLVCGGRDYADKAEVFRRLTNLHWSRGILAVVHGGARGADRLARDWARNEEGVYEVPIVALWRHFERSAGPRRNQAMLDICKIDLAIAFPGGDGTADMVKRLEQAGIHVARHG